MKISKDVVKPTKAQAFEIIKTALESSITRINRHQLEALYLFFVPEVRAAKDAFAWVALACFDRKKVNKSPLKENLCFVHVENGIAYGTNGAVVHTAQLDLPDGFYDPKSKCRVEGVSTKYPYLDNCFPSGTFKAITIENYQTKYRSNQDVKDGVIKVLDYIYNYKLFDRAFGLDTKQTLELAIFASGVIYNKTKYGWAVLMPMRE